MNKKMRKLLLVIITLALVVSPLRGALALPMIAVDDTDHCAQMQDDAHSLDHTAGIPDSAAGNPDNSCEQGCGGDCCDGACSVCTHGTSVLFSNITGVLEVRNNIQIINEFIVFSGQLVHPPFRPPISPHS